MYLARSRFLLGTLMSVGVLLGVVEAASTLGGAIPGPLPIFPADNWWNLNIAQASVDPSSANYISFIAAKIGMQLSGRADERNVIRG